MGKGGGERGGGGGKGERGMGRECGGGGLNLIKELEKWYPIEQEAHV
jgi:hypothetical protein